MVDSVVAHAKTHLSSHVLEAESERSLQIYW